MVTTNISGTEYQGRTLASIIRREFGRTATYERKADPNGGEWGYVTGPNRTGATPILGRIVWVEGHEEPTYIQTPEEARRLTGADLAARRHLVGLTLDDLADELGVNPRTVRSWESGRDLIPHRITDELDTLIADHGREVQRVLDCDTYEIVRDGESDMPRGWYVAAVARALQIEPSNPVESEWV